MKSSLPVSMAEDIRQAVEWVEWINGPDDTPPPDFDGWKYNEEEFDELIDLARQIVHPDWLI